MEESERRSERDSERDGSIEIEKGENGSVRSEVEPMDIGFGGEVFLSPDDTEVKITAFRYDGDEEPLTPPHVKVLLTSSGESRGELNMVAVLTADEAERLAQKLRSAVDVAEGRIKE